MSTDNGHKGSLWTFAAQPEKVNDFGYRAFHLSTGAAKSIVKTFYGHGPRYSYFVGCSQGGHHGLMEAQRFPHDYDGIVAGDPGNDWTHLMIGELWTGVVSSVKGSASDLPQVKLNLITNAVLATCGDPVNGPLGFLVDPRRCHFDPSTLLCQGADNASCLTASQLETVKLLYQGAVNPRTKESIFPGFTRGSENAWRQVLVGAHLPDGTPIPGGSSYEFFRNGVFMNPGYDFLSFNFDSDALFTDIKPAGSGETYESALDANDPDLEVFKKLGGKLILYHGFADPFVTPLNTTNYYERVVAAMRRGRHDRDDSHGRGDLHETQEFARLFMVPGMWHCAGGPGPSRFDTFPALEQWVEQGEAPDRIIGSHVDATGAVTFTRPLCPYPQEAVYKGHGATTNAANFACRVVGRDDHEGEGDEGD
jgi:feruloyl esterase